MWNSILALAPHNFTCGVSVVLDTELLCLITGMSLIIVNCTYQTRKSYGICAHTHALL